MHLIPDPRSLIPSPDPRSLIPSPDPRSLIPDPFHKGFTLIELLIVIGIIAILAGVLLSTFGGATESARLAKCQSNLRNLAAAANTYAMETEHYPLAGSEQYMSTEISDSGDIIIKVCEGWVSWQDKGMFKGKVTSERSVNQSYYVGNDEDVTHALTNGAIWRAVGRNHSVYQCPVHMKTCQDEAKRTPGWSYAMNPYFGCEREKGKALPDLERIYMSGLRRADRRLLFAEIPGLSEKKVNPKKYGATKLPELNFSSGSQYTDGILQYRATADGGGTGGGGANTSSSGSAPESMGFNHIRGRNIVGLVAFADGHTEALVIPKNGNFEELTGWLCGGYDITFSNGEYEKINDTNVD